MSGGHWDYCGSRIRNDLETISEDAEILLRFPELAKILSDLGQVLYKIEKDLDWDLSGDSKIKDDQVFEDQTLNSFVECVVKMLLKERKQ